EVGGVDGELRRNVLAVLSLARGGGGGSMEAARVRDLHGRAQGEIELALQPFGHYEARVDGTLQYDGRRWVASYNIEPGPPVLLTRVDLRISGSGESDPSFQEVLQQSQLVVGEPLSHAGYEAIKLRFEGVAAERGYLDAVFETAVIEVDREKLSAEIMVHFITGPRFQLGPVTFFQDVLDQEILRRMVPFRPGAPFEAQQLLTLRNAVTAGPYFSGVEIVPRRDQADGLQVPLDVHLAPHRPQRYLIGAGYGTDTGPRGTVEVEFRRVNKKGHRAEGQFRASLIERRLSTRYSLPLGAQGGLLSFSAGFVDSNPSTSDTETFLLGANLSKLFGGWKQDLSVTLQRASFEVGLDSGLSTLLVLGLGLSRVRADDRIFPSWGSLVSFQIRGSHDGLVSDTRLLQLSVEGKLVRSLGSRVRFLGRGEAGALYSPDFRALPASFRYFAGGDRSVRGYRYQSLGPLDEEGNVIGGDRKLVLSLELDVRILDRWGVATFADGGNALTSFSRPWEKGAGIGLRWRSPIGMIRLDGAFALGGHRTPFRVHLNIGPEL
ncbi:MAG: autotransporter assembly complex protein TamA, partial [Gemmatimonadetes bacterium]|nr:autotransporter assembly complex protein TamA [Gemmatimonadota bacterium]